MLRSTFFGLNIAGSGLNIAQRQIDVTSHNVANSNVEGYSRQRYVTSAIEPGGIPRQFADPTRGQCGGGVESLSLDQIRNIFLDQQHRNQQPKTSYWETKADALYYVEDVFNSTDETSLDSIMSQFFNSVQELSKDPTSEAIRTNVVQEAKKLTTTFNTYHTQLTDLMTQQNVNLCEQTKKTNEYITRLIDLNENILHFEVGGSVANDLRDERNLILDNLSSMMDITYQYTSYDPPIYSMNNIELTKLDVYAGGNGGEMYEDNLLVSHKTPYYMEMEDVVGINNIADDNVPPITTTVLRLASGISFDSDAIDGLNGGILKSYIDNRDSIDPDNPGIPYFIQQLNVMVESFVTEFNSVHSLGYTMPFDNVNGVSDSHTGMNFFNPDGITAANIAVADDILISSFNIAASSEYVAIDWEGHLQTGNNQTALDLIKHVKESTDLDAVGSYSGFFKNFIGFLASETSRANNMEASNYVLLDSIQAQRVSEMGVSIDEEMTSLIRFQHAYNSSARAITSIDEMLDKLINGTGRCGL